jgi:hypothetical protein
MWQEHEVATRQPIVKQVHHPLTGPLEFDCRVLHIPDTGQRLIVYCAAAGSPTQAAFRQDCVTHNRAMLEIRFTQAARKHRIRRAAVRHVRAP